VESPHFYAALALEEKIAAARTLSIAAATAPVSIFEHTTGTRPKEQKLKPIFQYFSFFVSFKMR
jgi:hypothetical protein